MQSRNVTELRRDSKDGSCTYNILLLFKVKLTYGSIAAIFFNYTRRFTLLKCRESFTLKNYTYYQGEIPILIREEYKSHP